MATWSAPGHRSRTCSLLPQLQLTTAESLRQSLAAIRLHMHPPSGAARYPNRRISVHRQLPRRLLLPPQWRPYECPCSSPTRRCAIEITCGPLVHTCTITRIFTCFSCRAEVTCTNRTTRNQVDTRQSATSRISRVVKSAWPNSASVIRATIHPLEFTLALSHLRHQVPP